MKIRIQVAAGGTAATFVHPGPVVRIGRDPACELALEGKAAETASRQHARIDLGPAGATLTDTGSSNGTFLNDRRIDRPEPLRAGDRVRLGQTGAELTVLEVDCAPASAGPAAVTPVWQRPAVLAAAALAVPLLGGLVWLATRGGGAPATTTALAGGTPVATNPVPDKPPVTPVTPPVTPPVAPVPPVPVPAKPPADPVPAKPGPPPAAAAGEDPVLGRYEVPEKWVNVMLQRRGEAYPWSVLVPGDEVRAGHTLVSLPGYQGLVVLDSGVRLTLWGSLPDQGPGAPVLESVVMLHAPEPGHDADLTLDRGRVRLVNDKKDGAARVRVRFQREAWEVALPRGGEAVLELYGQPYWSAGGAGGRAAPRVSLDVTAKGTVGLKLPGRAVELGDRSRLRWGQGTGAGQPEALKELPAWWAGAAPADPAAKAVQEKARRSLLDWSDRLGGTTAGKKREGEPATVVTLVKSGVVGVDDRDNQDVGVLFLAALDQVEPLVDMMAEPRYTNVRGAAYLALQAWLGRDPAHASRLEGLLAKKEGDPALARTVVRLLHFYPEAAPRERQTYEELVGWLGHESPLVRDLAFWQLDALGAGGWLPAEAAAIAYRPDDPDAERRKKGMQAWQKLLADGKLPARRGG